jgi:hypothetical protein
MQMFIRNEYAVPEFDLKTKLFDDLQIKVNKSLIKFVLFSFLD